MNQNDRDFWNLRYLDGGNSGKGSIGLNKMWKWSKIRKTLSDSVLDYGCGDLSFWKGITKFETGLMDYTGVDISNEIIRKNSGKYRKYEFEVLPTTKYISPKKDLLCLDVLFHITALEDFDECLKFVNSHFINRCYIHTWNREPFNYKTDYQMYHPIDSILDKLEFDSIVEYQNPFSKVNSLYVITRDL